MIPSLQTEKPSAIQVLSSAKDYIEDLTKRSAELDAEIEAVTGKKSLASSQSLRATREKAKPRPTRASRAEETLTLEGIRQENSGLRARLEELKRQASSKSPSQGPRDFTPSQLHVFSSPRELSASPHPPLPQMLNISSPSDDVEQQSALSVPSQRTPVLSRSGSRSPGGDSQSPERVSPVPILRTNHMRVLFSISHSQADALRHCLVFSLTIIYDIVCFYLFCVFESSGRPEHVPKRVKLPSKPPKEEIKSVSLSFLGVLLFHRTLLLSDSFFFHLFSDNDFETAKREFYSRRNSTVEDLKDQQQRVFVFFSADLNSKVGFADLYRRLIFLRFPKLGC